LQFPDELGRSGCVVMAFRSMEALYQHAEATSLGPLNESLPGFTLALLVALVVR